MGAADAGQHGGDVAIAGPAARRAGGIASKFRKGGAPAWRPRRRSLPLSFRSRMRRDRGRRSADPGARREVPGGEARTRTGASRIHRRGACSRRGRCARNLWPSRRAPRVEGRCFARRAQATRRSLREKLLGRSCACPWPRIVVAYRRRFRADDSRRRRNLRPALGPVHGPRVTPRGGRNRFSSAVDPSQRQFVGQSAGASRTKSVGPEVRPRRKAQLIGVSGMAQALGPARPSDKPKRLGYFSVCRRSCASAVSGSSSIPTTTRPPMFTS